MRRVTLLAIVAAFWLPSSASAADFIALTVSPTLVAPGWTLSATVTNGSFSRGDEIAGLTLRRSFLRGRAEEQHALRAHPDPTTISFDGRRGRWAATLGSAAGVNLAIETTGAPVAVEEAWGCRGPFVRLPVSLRGTLMLRTGTRFFKTIRRTRLAGFITTNVGPVSCDPPAAGACEPSVALHAGRLESSVLASPRRLGLQFREPVSTTGGSVAWYHVVAATGYDALAGTPPAVRVATPIRGSLRFVGQETKESSFGACRTTSTTGSASGTLGTTFVGWGARTLRLAGLPATLSETR